MHCIQATCIFQCLCATDEDVVDGDVNQLDDVANEAHNQDWNAIGQQVVFEGCAFGPGIFFSVELLNMTQRQLQRVAQTPRNRTGKGWKRGVTYSRHQLLGRSVVLQVSLRPPRIVTSCMQTYLEKLLLVGLLAPLHELHTIVDKLLGRLEDL